MSENMPTTEEVREAYQSKDDGLDFKRAFHERGAAFDAWLESVKFQAWQECWDTADADMNPYTPKEN